MNDVTLSDDEMSRKMETALRQIKGILTLITSDEDAAGPISDAADAAHGLTTSAEQLLQHWWKGKRSAHKVASLPLSPIN